MCALLRKRVRETSQTEGPARRQRTASERRTVSTKETSFVGAKRCVAIIIIHKYYKAQWYNISRSSLPATDEFQVPRGYGDV